MNENIVAGLVSGLLVTLLVVVFRAIWRGNIVPWFEDRVYKDIQIEGVWYSLYPTVIGERQETVSLKRHGHAVSGTIICTTGNDEGEQYTVSGSFRNLILTLIYETKDKQKVDRGTISLKCVQNGKRFAGKIAIYQDSSDTIDDNELLWFRSKKNLNDVLETVKKNKELAKKIRERERETKEEVHQLSQSENTDEELNNPSSNENDNTDSSGK